MHRKPAGLWCVLHFIDTKEKRSKDIKWTIPSVSPPPGCLPSSGERTGSTGDISSPACREWAGRGPSLPGWIWRGRRETGRERAGRTCSASSLRRSGLNCSWWLLDVFWLTDGDGAGMTLFIWSRQTSGRLQSSLYNDCPLSASI